MELDIRAGVFINPDSYEVTKNSKWAPTKNGYRNTYIDQYSVHLNDPRVHHKVFVGSFDSEDQAISFIHTRCTAIDIPATTIHEDICRCGALYDKIDFAITDNIVWKRHTLCGRPISHKDMMDLNAKALKDFDLDSLFD